MRGEFDRGGVGKNNEQETVEFRFVKGFAKVERKSTQYT